MTFVDEFSKFRKIVHQKTATALCLTTIKNEDKLEFSRILEAIKANFSDKYDEYMKKWGGGIMGSKLRQKQRQKREFWPRGCQRIPTAQQD
ncbi:hypothetical protein R6Q59_025303 [Mikania micrantha]